MDINPPKKDKKTISPRQESMHSSDNSDENSADSNAKEGCIKIEAVESKPSISQETSKIERNP